MTTHTPSLFGPVEKPLGKHPTYDQLRRACDSGAAIKSDHVPDTTKMVRRDAPDTSREAGAAMSQHASRLESLALHAIRLAGATGATFDELAAGLGWPQSQSGRITALLRSGAIRDTGARRTTRAGHSARVYVAVEGGAQ